MDVVSGNQISQNFPFNVTEDFNYSQHIYLNSEIGVNGRITSLSFESNDFEPLNQMATIYLGTTSKTSFSALNDWIDINTMTPVWSGLANSSTFNLQQPFYIYGSQNLVVAITQNTDAASSTSLTGFFCDQFLNNRSIYESSSYSKSNPYNYSADGLSTKVPNISFNIDTSPFVSNLEGLEPFYSCSGANSEVQTTNVVGYNLSSNLNLSLTGDFEISTSLSGTYSSSITIQKNNNNNVPLTPIYIRSKTTASGTHQGSLSISSTGATGKQLTLIGEAYTNPKIVSINSSISSFYSCQSSVSSSKSVEIAAYCLSGNNRNSSLKFPSVKR